MILDKRRVILTAIHLSVCVQLSQSAAPPCDPNDPNSCNDMMECQTYNNPANPGQKLSNCYCKSGFNSINDGATCEDVDECAANQHRCNQNQVCVNTHGGHKCDCPEGYKTRQMGRDYTICIDINECAIKKDNPEDGSKRSLNGCGSIAGSTCKNIDGSFECECKKGYDENNRHKDCRDINECDRGIDGCDSISTTCENLPGFFKCACKKGFQKSPSQGATDACTDIDECSNIRLNKCDYKSFNNFYNDNKREKIATCTNLPGSFQCQCVDEGRHWDSEFTYLKDQNGRETDIIKSHKCVNINECDRFSPCDLSKSRCVDKIGSYECKCQPGYKNDPNNPDKCIDINECELTGNDYPCDKINGSCINTIGSYTCLCNKGFEPEILENGKTNFKSCVDIDECAPNNIQHDCDCNSKNDRNCSTDESYCVNTIGSYHCECKQGFELNSSKSCQDINECLLEENVCDPGFTSEESGFECLNNLGSYICRCKQHYQQDLNTGRCVAMGCNGYSKCRSPAMCIVDKQTKQPSCACPKYYEKSGPYGCQDINECLNYCMNFSFDENNCPCAIKQDCKNNIGAAATCTWPAGMETTEAPPSPDTPPTPFKYCDQNVCEEIGVNTETCVEDDDVGRKYRCQCKKGFSGLNCQFVDQVIPTPTTPTETTSSENDEEENEKKDSTFVTRDQLLINATKFEKIICWGMKQEMDVQNLSNQLEDSDSLYCSLINTSFVTLITSMMFSISCLISSRKNRSPVIYRAGSGF